MQRKPGFPVANCNIKMPDGMPVTESIPMDEDGEQVQRRQQLINFGHAQWGFNNWSWSASKQDLDFVDFSNGKYCAGVVAFVSITVKTFDIHRENIGYATSVAQNKGSAIYKSRKCAVTNALRETLLSFGGSVATELLELLESTKSELPHQPDILPENNPNLANKLPEPKNSKNLRKDSTDSNSSTANHVRPAMVVKNAVVNAPPVATTHPMPANVPPVATAHPIPVNVPPVATAHPIPVNVPPAGPPPGARPPPGPASRPPPHAPRPNSNVSFVLQPVLGGVVPPMYPPRLPPPHVAPQLYPNYYEYSFGPWHFTYESYDRNVNLNFNIPPKNLVLNRSGSECKNACGIRGPPPGPEGEPLQYGPGPQNQGCWIKPTIFYDGFWTEQKVKKWVAEQVEKQFPEDSTQKSPSPSNGQDSSASKS